MTILSVAEHLELCATDGVLYSHVFFPKTVRQESPGFHYEIWDKLENPRNRYVGLKIFRGGAKTSICRIFTSKRVAYGISRTILYVGKSEGHAARSLRWIKRQVEFNTAWSQTFQLSKGSVWSNTEIEIRHGIDNTAIYILATGITGSIRGINLDDFRPDLIVLDDVQDEENSATPEYRMKIEDLVFGALKESLAPESECPDAMMAVLQTPLDREDIISKCEDDPEFSYMRCSIITKETEDLPIELQKSVWPERWSDEVVRREKQAAFARNQASLWYREKECKLISRETSDFDLDWLQYWDIFPERMFVIMTIDPVPPPSDLQVQKGLAKKDFEVINVLGVSAGKVYDLEYSINRGHSPDWTIAEFFRLKAKWKPMKCVVIAYNYEKTLQWLLERAMRQRREYVQVDTFPDRRSKRDRIVQGLNGVMSNRMFFVHKSMTDLIAQINAYPNVSHDDIIETAAVGAEALLKNDYLEAEYEEILYDEDDLPELGNWRSAP